MFDVARAIALVWALYVVLRARARLEALVLVVAAYFFALAVASGFTIRSEGAQMPVMALMLALIGPSSMPRGPLPALPGATLVTHWPALVSVLTCVALIVQAHRLATRAEQLPESSLELRRLDALGRALILVAMLEGMSAGTRILPYLLDWGWTRHDAMFEDVP